MQTLVRFCSCIQQMTASRVAESPVEFTFGAVVCRVHMLDASGCKCPDYIWSTSIVADAQMPLVSVGCN